MSNTPISDEKRETVLAAMTSQRDADAKMRVHWHQAYQQRPYISEMEKMTDAKDRAVKALKEIAQACGWIMQANEDPDDDNGSAIESALSHIRSLAIKTISELEEVKK